MEKGLIIVAFVFGNIDSIRDNDLTFIQYNIKEIDFCTALTKGKIK